MLEVGAKQQDVIEKNKIRKYRLACLLYYHKSCAKNSVHPRGLMLFHSLRPRLVNFVADTDNARLDGCRAEHDYEGCLLRL